MSWIRLVAMFSVVMVHSVLYASVDETPETARPFQVLPDYQLTAYCVLVQALRFGSILFFLVSGYLFGKQADTRSPGHYFLRRLQTIAVPYLIAYTLFWLKSVVFNVLLNWPMPSPDLLSLGLHKAESLMFNSAYWFVPNYLFGLAILLVVRQYLDRWWLGALFLTASLFYGLNIYGGWVRIGGPQLFFCFTFYIWLGAFLARHPHVLEWLTRLSSGWWLLLTVITFSLAYYEGRLLVGTDTGDPFPSLRITNQFFAFSLFMLLVKNNFLSRLSGLDPRRESYGIYLYHMFFITASHRFGQYVGWWPFRYEAGASGLTMVLLSIGHGLLMYALTLLFVKLINRSPLAWLLGNRRAAAPAT